MHSSFLIHERSAAYHWEGVGALSIKTFRRGRALYSTGAGYHLVDDSCYLILNQDQWYSVTIESLRAVEAFCIFLGPELAGDVYRNATTGSDRLLDDPHAPAAVPAFVERTYAHDKDLSPAVARLRLLVSGGQQVSGRQVEGTWLTEQLHSLMKRLLRVHRRVVGEMNTLPAARPVTREEIYRRAHLARDYLLAHLDRGVTLREAASASAFSVNHLLRSFRHVFGQSPHQFLTAERIARAQRLLAATDTPVTDVCLAVGFESVGSFSTLFRRRTGLSPQAYRKTMR